MAQTQQTSPVPASDYWKRVLRRALKDTVATLHLEPPKRLIGAVILSLAAVVILWLVGDKHAATEEIEAKAAVTAAIVLAFPLIYIYQFARAPARLDLELRKERDDAQSRLNDKQARQDALDQLAALRAHGITHLVRAKVTSDTELEKWAADYENWGQSVVNLLNAKFSAAERDSFIHIGSVMAASYSQQYNNQHNTWLLQLDERLNRLQEIVSVRAAS